MGVFVIPPLPPVLSEDHPQQGSFAPPAFAGFFATASPSATLSPFSPLPGVAGYRAYLAPGISPGTRRASPVAVAPLPPCRRCHPAGVDVSLQSECDAPMLPSRTGQALGLRGLTISGLLRVHFRCGLATHSPSFPMALSAGFEVSVSLHLSAQATGPLTLTPAGLTPAELDNLSWTRGRPCPARSPRGEAHGRARPAVPPMSGGG